MAHIRMLQRKWIGDRTSNRSLRRLSSSLSLQFERSCLFYSELLGSEI